MNKLRAFLLRPAMRVIVGQAEPRFDLSQIFTERRILLVNLAKGLLGPETSALLGSLVVSQLWQATLGRSAIAPDRRHPVFVYVDEFQDYLHLPTDLADVLAQARGLGVGLTLAHQHLGQLPHNMKSAVLANARSRVCFQLGQEDAALIARGERQPTQEDFQGLSAYQTYVSLVAKSQKTAWASGRTLPPPPSNQTAEFVAARSRQQWGVPKTEVEAAIRELTVSSSRKETIGSRPRRLQNNEPGAKS